MTAPVCLWHPPPATIVLGNDEVHVWRATLDLEASAIRHLEQTLDADECDRAGRFHFAAHRDRFIAAHGWLRAILSQYLKTRPAELQFERKSTGKPSLAACVNHDALRFNMSHSHEFALYAVTKGREVGVDVESERDDIDILPIAVKFFSQSENEALLSLPDRERRRAFFQYWTCKEAYLKATGAGLSIPTTQFTIALAPQTRDAKLMIQNDPHESSRWSLVVVDPGPGFIAAIAAEGTLDTVRCWQWTTPQRVDI